MTDDKNKNVPEAVHAYLAKIGAKGGQQRARKYGKDMLRKWAKLGGRPKKKKG